MFDLIDELKSEFANYEYLSRFYIELGILDKDSHKIIKISAGDQEESITISNLLYFVEFGTFVLPARRILEYLLQQLQGEFDKGLSEIADKILEKNLSQQQIDSEMRLFEIRLNQKIPVLLKTFTYNLSYVENTAEIPLTSGQIMSPKFLIDYIKCRIYRK